MIEHAPNDFFVKVSFRDGDLFGSGGLFDHLRHGKGIISGLKFTTFVNILPKLRYFEVIYYLFS